jgi:tRNA modification GTPase
MIEALIDFGEGEDIEEGVYDQGDFSLLGVLMPGTLTCAARERVLDLHRTIQGHLSDNRRGEILRSGIRLAIFGPPNVGKSTLLNFLGVYTLS